jgi:hypothetical protein
MGCLPLAAGTITVRDNDLLRRALESLQPDTVP